MALYESVFIARQDISSGQVDALADAFQKIIEDGGGQVPKRENWGLRSLAYKIKKNRKGHYVLFNIDSPSEAVLEYERNMKLNEDILRYMTLRVDELDPEPSVVMQGRSRPDRGDRGDRGRRFDERPRSEAKPAGTPASEGAAPPAAEKSEAKPGEAKAGEDKAGEDKAPKTAAETTDAPAPDEAKSAKPESDDKDAKAAESVASKAGDEAADEAAAKKKTAATAKDDDNPAEVKKAATKTKKGEEA
ncbi:MAG: 30S ribosomal protein S6 [Alphaproteobacteria bacterium]